MNWTLAAAFALFLAGAAAVLAQLWLGLWDPETFTKLMISDGVILVVVLAWGLFERERRETARLRDKNRPGE